jgi:hypothetical protein
MTQENPTFNIADFELRGYTDPWLSPSQATVVAETEDRVNSQLDFLAQMLGWNGPNYWTNLANTVNQKRQLLGGTFGVYNSYIIPKIYEIRNWTTEVKDSAGNVIKTTVDAIVIDQLQFLQPGRQTRVARILLGEDVYSIRSIDTEGDKYVISIGPLSQNFFDQIAANVPLRVDVPTYRPAPFYRPTVGASGDYSFICGNTGSTLNLYPTYDTQKKFPFRFPILFSGSVYYFDQPIYLAIDSSLTPEVSPSYDSDIDKWFLEIPSSFQTSVGLTAYLVWANTDPVVANNYSLEISIQGWVDPSDWGSINVLDNFRGTWGNKGGQLPFNFVFDTLSLHGFDEKNSVYLPTLERGLNFNDIVNFVYYQKTTISDIAPGGANPGDLWWSDQTGLLSVWLPNDGCGTWVEIDYRQSPRQIPPPQVVYADVSEFNSNSGSLSVGTIVHITNAQGLGVAQNVIGVTGTLTSPVGLTLHRATDAPYWTPDEFRYADKDTFEADATVLPFKVPVALTSASGLSPEGSSFTVKNLSITITGDYEVLLMKYYNNTTWEIYPDSILKYIAYSALFGGSLQGQMWWDYGMTNPDARAAAIYYENAWVGVNTHAQSGPVAPTLDLGTVLFYCNGTLVKPDIAYVSPDFTFTYSEDPATGKYGIVYQPLTFKGCGQLPAITISDSLTTTYRTDITDLLFSGITYYMSPNVYDAETPLRLWKAQALQVAETEAHLIEDNYINPLLADLNNGPGPENWEKYFVRLPLDYGRNEDEWQKVALVCQDFGYWGSAIDPEEMRCPAEDDTPVIYEELFLYDGPINDYTYVYAEPYFYSNLGYFDAVESGQFRNAAVFPATGQKFDEFDEAEFIEYDPLHNRLAHTVLPTGEIKEVTELLTIAITANDTVRIRQLSRRLFSLTGKQYGDWVGEYVNINPCVPLTGFLTTDLEDRGVVPVEAPVWDASIYKFAPTCENAKASYNVDANHYKIGYAYFVADASAAEDAFFDISQEASWRYPVTQPKTLYLTPR